MFIYVLNTTNCMTLYVAPCFDQLRGRPQTTRARKTKITFAYFMLGQNQISVRYTIHKNEI